MKYIYSFLLKSLDSSASLILIILICLISFYIGQTTQNMSVFSSAGSLTTVFGLFSMIRFTTIEKYLNKQSIINQNTGVTGPPISQEEAKKIAIQNKELAKIQINKELKKEFKGIILTIIGTLISAYGIYIPIFISL